jgi:hypothetical protein
MHCEPDRRRLRPGPGHAARGDRAPARSCALLLQGLLPHALDRRCVEARGPSSIDLGIAGAELRRLASPSSLPPTLMGCRVNDNVTSTPIVIGPGLNWFLQGSIGGLSNGPITGSLDYSVALDVEPASVPTPSTFPLFATGLGLMGWLAWRRSGRLGTSVSVCPEGRA